MSHTPTALILIADGSEEIEFVTPYDILTRAGVQIQSCGVNLQSSYATCSRNVRIVPDTTELPKEPSTDILILPGGAKGAKTFASTPEVLHLIRAYRDSDRRVAFICAATTALLASVSSAGKTEGLASAKPARVTSHPSVKQAIVDAGWDYAPDADRVVVDGKVITSRGPGSAMLFALQIVEALCGRAKRDEITGPLIPPKEL